MGLGKAFGALLGCAVGVTAGVLLAPMIVASAGVAAVGAAVAVTAGTVVAGGTAGLIAGGATGDFAESFVSHVFLDRASRLRIGAVVFCDLFLFEHSGIFIGRNQIVHLTGDGEIEKVSPKRFMERCDGINTAIAIYISCKNGEVVGDQEVARRARKMVGKTRKYNMFFDNCHQFSSGCLTGNFGNDDNPLTFLKDTAKKKLGADEWRIWEEIPSKELPNQSTKKSKIIVKNISCPLCEREGYTDGPLFYCKHCNESFNLNQNGDLIGNMADCPYCSESFYSEDLLTDCPHCGEEVIICKTVICPLCEREGYAEGTSFYCTHCKENFNLKENGELIGNMVDCPHCGNPFYTEESSADCPHCEKNVNLDKNGIPTGRTVKCPSCKKSFYSEDSSVSCPFCNIDFSFNKKGELIGNIVKCPLCKEKSYAEGSSFYCAHCKDTFAIDKKGKLIGEWLKCPECKESFYTEEAQGTDIECPYCNIELKIQ